MSYQALFPGHLEDLLIFLQEKFEELPWSEEKKKYLYEEWDRIERECATHVQPEPRLKHSEAPIDGLCKSG